MVQKIEGFRTRDGQFIADEESAIIAETMAEIISTIPELRLIADKVQANLRSLCLHTQQLAAFYAKNHPRVLRETTLVPDWKDLQTRFNQQIEENLGEYPPIEPEDRPCDCSALLNGATDHHPSCGAWRPTPNNIPVVNPVDWVEFPFNPLPTSRVDLVHEDRPEAGATACL